MSKKKKGQITENNLEQVEEVLSKGEQFIEKNQKQLSFIALLIIIAVGTYLSYNKFYLAPLQERAQAQMYQAQRYFEQDSFYLAINGDGNYEGFLDIIDEYGATNAANLANYYCGISYLKLGNFNEAITYLNKFSSDDFLIAPLAKAAIGDAYWELGEVEKAASFYMKASEINTNIFTTPIYLQKAGVACEQSKQFEKALKVYQKIEKDYAQSPEARDIEKYITRVKAMME